MSNLPERKRITMTWWAINAAIIVALVIYGLRG